MERNPLRLAWNTDPLRHLLGFLLLTAAGLLFLFGLDLIRVVTDRAVGGAGAWNAPGTLLRIAVHPPRSLWPEPLELFPGFTLAPEAFAPAAVAGLILVPLLAALALAALGRIAAGIGSAVLARARTAILDAVIKAPPSAQEEVSTATALAAGGLAHEGGVLGASLLTPLRLGGMIGLSFAYVLVADWHLGATLALALALVGVLNARRFLLRIEATKTRHQEGEAAGEILADLKQRIPALRAHGTAAYERERVRRALGAGRDPIVKRESRLALADAAAAAALMIAPLSVLAIGAWSSQDRPLTAGTLAACVLAAAVAAYGVREIVQWHRVETRAQALLTEAAQSLALLKPRGEARRALPMPDSGALVATGVSAYDPGSGARIAAVDLNLAFPSHVALVGDGDSGPRLLAALLGGQVHPSTGSLTYGGIDLVAADPAERCAHIAFSGDTVLIEGSLKENLLYGCPAPAQERDHRLSEAIAVTGLDRLTHARGLAGTLNPKREPAVAAAIVESRRAVQAALAREKLDRFVDPFNAERYNRYATVGENLLFGKPIGDTFREDRLSGHPFVRAVLEADDLTKPLARVGLSIATSMIEIFADVPGGHPLFERFSFFSAADRAYFQDLVARQVQQRRSAQTGRDQERLIGLALRYNESRHRLGLVDEAMEARILTARADFARMLPVSLKPSIEFYDHARFCAAASVQDNLLFGRVASDQAGALDAVQAVIRRILTERGLDGEVSRIGLDRPIDVGGDDLTSSEIAAIDLARCLVRRPSVLVVQRALEGLPQPAADRLVLALRRALVGRGLVLVTPAISPALDHPPFDAVIRFERGEPMMDHQVRPLEALSA